LSKPNTFPELGRSGFHANILKLVSLDVKSQPPQ